MVAAIAAAVFAWRAARASEAGVAAYFTLDHLEYNLPETGDDISITIMLRNRGATPARYYKHQFVVEVRPRGYDYERLPEIGIDRTDNIGPDGAVNLVGETARIGQAAIRDIKSGKKLLFVRGAIEFYDLTWHFHRIDFGRKSKEPFNKVVGKSENGSPTYRTSRWIWNEDIRRLLSFKKAPEREFARIRKSDLNFDTTSGSIQVIHELADSAL